MTIFCIGHRRYFDTTYKVSVSMPLLPVLFIVVPFLELMILIQLGAAVGLFPTLGMVLTTAMIGYLLLQQQGMQVWQRVNHTLQQGELPSQSLLEGLIILIAGAFMITPGLITDAFGLFCLIPVTRRMVLRVLAKRFKGRVERYSAYSVHQRSQPTGSNTVYEGDADDITEADPAESGNRGALEHSQSDHSSK